MKKILLAIVLAVGALSLCGCQGNRQTYKVDEKFLPTDAKNVKHLGSYWTTFQITVNGKQRTFMYHVSCQGGRETLVELKE